MVSFYRCCCFPLIHQICENVDTEVPSVQALPDRLSGLTVSTKTNCTKFCCKDQVLSCFSRSELRHILPAHISLISCNWFIISCNILLLLFELVLLETEQTSRNPLVADFYKSRIRLDLFCWYITNEGLLK